MIRGIAEAVGWFIFICALANLAGLVEFRLSLNAPRDDLTNECIKEQSVPSKQTPPSTMDVKLRQIKRDARRLTKTQPLTHSQALEKLSKEQGYSTYAALRAALKTELA